MREENSSNGFDLKEENWSNGFDLDVTLLVSGLREYAYNPFHIYAKLME